MNDTPYNAANRKDIREAEKDAKRTENERLETIRNLCSTTSGRRYVWHRLAEARIFHTTFSNDFATMAFNEGQRNAGLSLLNDVLAACPEQFTRMMQEHNQKELARAAARSTARTSPPEHDAGERPDGEDAGRDVDTADTDPTLYDGDTAGSGLETYYPN